MVGGRDYGESQTVTKRVSGGGRSQKQRCACSSARREYQEQENKDVEEREREISVNRIFKYLGTRTLMKIAPIRFNTSKNYGSRDDNPKM